MHRKRTKGKSTQNENHTLTCFCHNYSSYQVQFSWVVCNETSLQYNVESTLWASIYCYFLYALLEEAKHNIYSCRSLCIHYRKRAGITKGSLGYTYARCVTYKNFICEYEIKMCLSMYFSLSLPLYEGGIKAGSQNHFY